LLTDIDERTGWPEELKVLLKQFPRSTWKTSASPMARFWIDKHDYFRHQASQLDSAAQDYLEGRTTAVDFGTWLIPRLQGFLANLHGHHQIEDFHYFPAFRAADERLAPGFDVLAHDHETLHAGIIEIVESANAFLTTLPEQVAATADTQKHAAERYIGASRLVCRRLMRHLDDEEDLIIPLMLRQA
jgi:hypothetical protein